MMNDEIVDFSTTATSQNESTKATILYPTKFHPNDSDANDSFVQVNLPGDFVSRGVVYTLDTFLLPKFVFTPLLQLLQELPECSIMAKLLPIAYPFGLPAAFSPFTLLVPTDAAILLGFNYSNGDDLFSSYSINELVDIANNYIILSIIPSSRFNANTISTFKTIG